MGTRTERNYDDFKKDYERHKKSNIKDVNSLEESVETLETKIINVYNDFDFPTTQLKSVGVSDKPDFDVTNLGFLMPKNNTTEIIGGSRQFPHNWVKSSIVYPHIHIIQAENVQYVFKMQYRCYDIGSLIPAYSSVLTSTGYAKTYSGGMLHQIVNFDPIDLATILGNSAWFDVKIWRDDNVGMGDILLKGFDLHILLNRIGSVGEFNY